MSQIGKNLLTALPWLALCGWAWYTTFQSDINPFRIATITAGVALTVITFLQVFATERSRLVPAVQFLFAFGGAGIVAGMVVMAQTTLQIPNVLTDYTQEVTFPLVALTVAAVIFGYFTWRLESGAVRPTAAVSPSRSYAS